MVVDYSQLLFLPFTKGQSAIFLLRHNVIHKGKMSRLNISALFTFYCNAENENGIPPSFKLFVVLISCTFY